MNLPRPTYQVTYSVLYNTLEGKKGSMGFGECITRFGKVCTRMFLNVGTFKEGTGKVTKVLLMVHMHFFLEIESSNYV